MITERVFISENSEAIFGGQVDIEPEPTNQILCFPVPFECVAHDVAKSVTFQVSMEWHQPG